MKSFACAVAAVLGLICAPTTLVAFGDTATLAPFPANPGFPEGVAVKDGIVYAAGAATLGTTGAGPSAVIAYDRATGAVVRRYDTVGENRLSEHGGSSIAFGTDGRLYVLNTQLGLYRLDVATGAQEAYSSPFPDLKPCLPIIHTTNCSPNPVDLPPLPNDIAFAPNGDAYVTDSFQATIWRVPAGGGAPQIWLQSAKFVSPYIGVNGLRLSPDGSALYATVSIPLTGAGTLYRIPLATRALQKVHTFALGDLPDGIAFTAGGDIAVVQAGPLSAGVDIVSPAGIVKRTVRGPLFDGPANIAFDGAGRALMTNHAPVTGLVLRKFSILDVDLEDAGTPLP